MSGAPKKAQPPKAPAGTSRDQQKARKMYEAMLKKSGSPFKPPKDVTFQPDPRHKNQWWAWTNHAKDRRSGQNGNGRIMVKHAHFGEDARKGRDKYFIRGEYSYLGIFAVKRAQGDFSKVESFTKFKQQNTIRFS